MLLFISRIHLESKDDILGSSDNLKVKDTAAAVVILAVVKSHQRLSSRSQPNAVDRQMKLGFTCTRSRKFPYKGAAFCLQWPILVDLTLDSVTPATAFLPLLIFLTNYLFAGLTRRWASSTRTDCTSTSILTKRLMMITWSMSGGPTV